MAWLFQQTKTFRWRIFLTTLLSTAIILIGIYTAVLTKQLIDEAAEFTTEATGGGAFREVFHQIPKVMGERPDIRNHLLIYFFLILLTVGFTALSSVISVYLNEKFAFHVRRQMFEKIIRTKWVEITQYHSGDLMTRLTSDVNTVAGGILGTLPSIFTLAVTFVASFITLAYYNPSLALFVFALAPIAIVISYFSGRKMKRYQLKIQESEGVYRSFLQESMESISVVKSFRLEETMDERLAGLYQEQMTWIVKKSKIGILMGSIMGLTYSLGYLAALAWGIFQIAVGATSYGTLSVYLALVSRIQAPVAGLAQTIPTVASMFASASRLQEVEDLGKEQYERLELGAKALGVSFEGVSFSYGRKEIFRKFNLEIEAGAMIAITGASGVGKTTFLRLLMDYLDPAEGGVFYEYIDEKGDLQKIPSSPAIRPYVSYVPQGNTLLSGSIRENLRMGNPRLTEIEMQDLLETVLLWEVVQGLGAGLDTNLGEKGHGLSEGQAQRLAIARALAKKSPVYIFDESTAALDEKTEMEVVSRMRKLPDNPTCILITHRREILPLLDGEIDFEQKGFLKK